MDLVNKVEELYQKGLKLELKEEFREALKCFMKVVSLNTQHQDAWIHLLDLLAEDEDFERYQEFMEKGLKSMPNSAALWSIKGAWVTCDDLDEGIKCYWKALQCQPRVALYWYHLGSCYKEQLNFKRALKCYSISFQLDPRRIFFELNYLYLECGMADEILEICKKMLSLEDLTELELSDIRSFMGLAYLENGDYDEALKHFKRSIEINPNPSFHTLESVGDVYDLKKDNMKALHYYKESLKLASFGGDAIIWIKIARIYRRLKRHGDAIKAYKESLSIDSSNKIIYFELVGLYEAKKDYSSMRPYFKQLLALEDIEILFSLASEWLEDEKHRDKAITCFETILEVDPGHHDSLFQIGLARSLKNQYDLAITSYLKFARVCCSDEDLIGTWINLSVSYYKIEQYERALLSVKKVLKIDSSNADSWILKGDINSRLNDKDGERNSYEKAYALNSKGAETYKMFAVSIKLLEIQSAIVKALPDEKWKATFTEDDLRVGISLNEWKFKFIDEEYVIAQYGFFLSPDVMIYGLIVNISSEFAAIACDSCKSNISFQILDEWRSLTKDFRELNNLKDVTDPNNINIIYSPSMSYSISDFYSYNDLTLRIKEIEEFVLNSFDFAKKKIAELKEIISKKASKQFFKN